MEEEEGPSYTLTFTLSFPHNQDTVSLKYVWHLCPTTSTITIIQCNTLSSGIPCSLLPISLLRPRRRSCQVFLHFHQLTFPQIEQFPPNFQYLWKDIKKLQQRMKLLFWFESNVMERNWQLFCQNIVACTLFFLPTPPLKCHYTGHGHLLWRLLSQKHRKAWFP